MDTAGSAAVALEFLDGYMRRRSARFTDRSACVHGPRGAMSGYDAGSPGPARVYCVVLFLWSRSLLLTTGITVIVRTEFGMMFIEEGYNTPTCSGCTNLEKNALSVTLLQVFLKRLLLMDLEESPQTYHCTVEILRIERSSNMIKRKFSHRIWGELNFSTPPVLRTPSGFVVTLASARGPARVDMERIPPFCTSTDRALEQESRSLFHAQFSS
ncbi:hypothetical protein EVAR_5567_1 [Eumeta japonica]|uniref:Uncharacterized protein n=1 Tax=Eumeta variegata TaxID=151549 RepID=A0A4C1U1S2_EUMVA|nr:hypothetical protein EVAR_5567_1 [Eumeta japonica]